MLSYVLLFVVYSVLLQFPHWLLLPIVTTSLQMRWRFLDLIQVSSWLLADFHDDDEHDTDDGMAEKVTFNHARDSHRSECGAGTSHRANRRLGSLCYCSTVRSTLFLLVSSRRKFLFLSSCGQRRLDLWLHHGRVVSCASYRMGCTAGGREWKSFIT